MAQHSSVLKIKLRLHKHSQGTQTQQRTQPVKASISDARDLMGNFSVSRLSKAKPTGSSSHHEATGSSAGRPSRTSERNLPAIRRSTSQQPEQRQHGSGNYPEYYSEKSTSRSEYDNGTRGAHKRSDYTTSSLTFDTTSRRNPKFGAAAIDSSVFPYGSGAGASAAASPDADYWKAQTGQYDLSESRGSSYAEIAPTYYSTSTFYGPSDFNSWSNVIDYSVSRYGTGAGGDHLKAQTGQSDLSQSRGSSYARIAPIHTYAMTYSGPSDSNSQSNGRQSRTVKTEQPGFQSQGSSYAQVDSMHTSAVTSESNNQSNGRQSRAMDRSESTRIRSASQGLRNLGNTCYMNSILQCLAKVPWFADGRERRSLFHDDLLNEFFSLMRKMQENDSDDSSLNPYQFRQQISSLGFRFSSSEQNDAHEFLLCLLSRLSKSLKSERRQDIVADILLGRQQNVIRFKDCKHVLINDQPFFSLSLPLTLDSGKSMFRDAIVILCQCLENYTRTEDVDGDALCMDCQRMQLCSIEASFKCPPKILIIHLKRYDFTRAEKMENEVSFPLEGLRIIQKDLNAAGEVEGYNDVTYDLFAVCNHYGSLRFGHYTADIKSPSNNWYNYSDSRVTQIHRMSSISREACILFYRQSHS